MGIHGTNWDDPIRDDELPDAADLVDGEMLAFVPCPSCGRSMPDDAERCNACGDWVTHGSPAHGRAGGWFWPVMVAGLIALIFVVWHGLGR